VPRGGIVEWYHRRPPFPDDALQHGDVMVHTTGMQPTAGLL
jgi:hypothetical protein